MNELPPQFETGGTLSEIENFLTVQNRNARLDRRGQQTNELALALEQAAVDFQNHDYQTTISVLERYQRIFRIRADEETDPDSVPVYDNARANEIQTWINFLKERPSS
jgi:hypothetical protein